MFIEGRFIIQLHEPMNWSSYMLNLDVHTILVPPSSPPLSSCPTLIIGLPLAPLVLGGHPKVLSRQRLAPLPK